MAVYKLISELRRSLDGKDRRSKGENQATAGELGREIFRFACSLACRLVEEIFSETDDALKEKEALGMKVAGFREKKVTSLFGDTKLRKRLYGAKKIITTSS